MQVNLRTTRNDENILRDNKLYSEFIYNELLDSIVYYRQCSKSVKGYIVKMKCSSVFIILF